MADNESKELARVPATIKGVKGFQKGHTRIPGSGRKKGQSGPTKFIWLAREIAEREGFDPFTMLITAFRTGTLPPIGGPGALDKDKKPLPPVTINAEERMKCGRDLMRYLMPTLSAMQVTGADGGPLQLEQVDVTHLMMDPALAQAAQTLALGLSSAQRQREEDIIDAEYEDVPQPANNGPTMAQTTPDKQAK